jgi:hypothetical protein
MIRAEISLPPASYYRSRPASWAIFWTGERKILEDAALANMDLGVDLHAGDEPQSNRGQPALSSIELCVQPGLV